MSLHLCILSYYLWLIIWLYQLVLLLVANPIFHKKLNSCTSVMLQCLTRAWQHLFPTWAVKVVPLCSPITTSLTHAVLYLVTFYVVNSYFGVFIKGIWRVGRYLMGFSDFGYLEKRMGNLCWLVSGTRSLSMDKAGTGVVFDVKGRAEMVGLWHSMLFIFPILTFSALFSEWSFLGHLSISFFCTFSWSTVFFAGNTPLPFPYLYTDHCLALWSLNC